MAEMAMGISSAVDIHWDASTLEIINSASTSLSSDLSLLTSPPLDNLGQLHHLPGHLSLSTQTVMADGLVDQALSVEGILSGLLNSPEARVEDNSLDCQEVEDILMSSLLQWVKVDLQ